MLREALPEIVTGSVPGAKAKAILDRRNEAVPKGLCGSTYPICMEKGEGAMLEDAGSSSNVVRFLAPLCMTEEQMEAGLKIFEESILANL